MNRLSCVLVLALAAVGCADDDRLSVLGELTVDVDGTPSGFEFAQRTHLVDDDIVAEDGPLAGHCRFGRDSEGDSVLSVALERPGVNPEGANIKRFQARISLTDAVEDEVFVELGLGDHVGTTASDDCTVTVDYADREDEHAGVLLDCVLQGPEASTAHVSGELYYAGCDDD